MKKSYLLFSIIFSIFLNTVSFAEPPNLALLKKEIETYHDSGNYQKELTQVINNANNFINDRSRNNAQQSHPAKLAVVLDIDETSLSNYNHLISHSYMASMESWHQAVEAADAPAIEPMLSFYNEALKQGIAVFFVTGRKESERLATDKNLKQAGYHNWAGLYLKPEDYANASAIPFKSEARAQISKKGYTVIASIGDQDSDLKGGYAEKTFKLPNPYYYIP